jgi:hypothetical protein
VLKQISGYVSSFISFSPNWTPAGSSKLFRVYSWDPKARNYFKYFKVGDAGPALFAGYATNKYGVMKQWINIPWVKPNKLNIMVN